MVMHHAPLVQLEELDAASWLPLHLDLRARLHADDPVYVAPMAAWLRRQLDPETNSFLRTASLRLFVARRDGEVVGTISALRDPHHERVREEAVAFFGFFACIDDDTVAQALLEQAAGAGREWGAEALRGPRNLSRIEEVGVTVEGFSVPPPFLAGHDPRWMRQLIEAQGFGKHHDVLTYEIELSEPDAQGRPVPRPMPEKLARQAAEVHIPGLEIRPCRWSSIRGDLSLAHEVFVDAFRDVPDNTPMPREQFVRMGAGLLLGTRRDMLQLATVDGRAAGFALCFPELNEALVHARGELFPTGGLRALAGFRGIRTASFKLLGVLPEYRGQGLHAALIAAAIEGVRAAGYERLEASLIDERNGPMRSIVEGAGLQIGRRYRLYERAL